MNDSYFVTSDFTSGRVEWTFYIHFLWLNWDYRWELAGAVQCWRNGIYKPQNFFCLRINPFFIRPVCRKAVSLPRCTPPADKWIAADLNGNSDYSSEISVKSNSLFQRENGKLGNNF